MTARCGPWRKTGTCAGFAGAPFASLVLLCRHLDSGSELGSRAIRRRRGVRRDGKGGRTRRSRRLCWDSATRGREEERREQAPARRVFTDRFFSSSCSFSSYHRRQPSL
ncbi:hypothetical protein LX36DRAFT_110064 [Colletotrichum falcatum]|nr:hypothetical protein LX36DRAFT_110064 [Colletotrichum falcatum]